MPTTTWSSRSPCLNWKPELGRCCDGQAHTPTLLSESESSRSTPDAREARLDGHPLELSPKEFDLLRVLVERAGQVVSKRELMAEVWREPYGGSDRTIDVHLSWLRRKLGESAQEPRYLHTVHGVGLKLVDPTR